MFTKQFGVGALPLGLFPSHVNEPRIFLKERLHLLNFGPRVGAVARLTGPTDRGAFLDIAFDFAIYAIIPLAFALADLTHNAMAASLLLASFMGTSSSFLAFAVIAAKRGATSASFPQKGIYYLGGLTEGTETIAAFTAMYLWPHHFPAIATIFSALAVLTTLFRWSWGWRVFSEPKL